MNLFIYVEGQEEEMFVNRVLRGHLGQFGVVVQKPILAATSFRIGGDKEADITVGGVTNYDSIREDIVNQFATGDINAADVLTTLIDLYALPALFPGHEKATSPSHRILDRIPTYQKINGFRHLQDIGLPELKAHCPRFKAWIEQCEKFYR